MAEADTGALRGWIVIGLLGLAIAHPHMSEAAAIGEKPQSLGAVSTAEVSSSRSMLLELKRSLALDDLDYTYSGRGRVIGFVLREQRNDDVSPARLTSFKLNRCSSKACPSPRHEVAIGASYNVDGSVLQPGLYRLYLIADGAPVRFRFELEGASGRRQLIPNESAFVVHRTLRPDLGSTAEGLAYWAGHFAAHERDESQGMSLLEMWSSDIGEHNETFGSCFYYNDALEDPPAETAFIPGCATGDADRHAEPEITDQGLAYVAMRSQLATGIGGWFTTSSAAENVGAVALWIGY